MNKKKMRPKKMRDLHNHQKHQAHAKHGKLCMYLGMYVMSLVLSKTYSQVHELSTNKDLL